jgi:CelD/BcsL family acetyltransferase involved in cellulose biosynthesis
VTIRSVDQLGAFAADWDALVDRTPLASPFLRSWWLSAVAADVDARFLLVCNDDTLLGGIAVEQRSLGALRLVRPLGYRVAPDHVGVVARPGHHVEVAAAVRSGLRRLGRIILVIPSADCTPVTLASMPGPFSAVISDVVPFVDLRDGYEAWLSRRSSNLRRGGLRRQRQRLEGGGARHVIIPPDQVPGALATLRRLHTGAHGERSLLVPEFSAFQRTVVAGVAAGEAAVHAMTMAGGEMAAVYVVFSVNGRASLVASGRSLARECDGAGLVTIDKIVRHASDHGCHEVDLLRGSEEYKLRLSDGVRDLVTLRCRRGLATRAMDGAAAVTRDAVRRAGQVRSRRNVGRSDS